MSSANNTKAVSITQCKDGKYIFHSRKPFIFQNGQEIPELTLVYETYGQLNADKSNVIVVHHALSTSSHVKSHAQNPQPGWWEAMIGPGAPLDTNRYFIICSNNLGSCFGSTGPSSINPATQKLYGMQFPTLTIEDMVEAQHLLIDALEIPVIHAMVSASMGAMISLVWAMRYPAKLKHLVSISSCYRSYPNSIAIRTIQREIIKLDTEWNQGNYLKNPPTGFTLARKLAHLTYRNPNELNSRFLEIAKNTNEQRTIHSYLEYNAKKFTDNFDTNCYLYLTAAMDQFDITYNMPDPIAPFRKIQAKTLIISVNSDTLFTPAQQQELWQMLQLANVPVEYLDYKSNYGHDAFLVETEKMGKHVSHFIK